MNTAPNSLPPRPKHQWASTCIPIDNVAGQPPINICDIFCYESFHCKESLILPPEIYPPEWEKRHETESQIIDSALKNDGTVHVRQQTDYGSGKKHSYLGCKQHELHSAVNSCNTTRIRSKVEEDPRMSQTLSPWLISSKKR